MTRIYIPPEMAGQRLDRALAHCLADVSRECIKRAIIEGHCCVDGIPTTMPRQNMQAGQCVDILLDTTNTHIVPETGPTHAHCLWEDEHILILHKDAGITVHPCPSCPQGTLIQRLAAQYPQLLQQEGARPGIVHRLDKDTSGLLCIALHEAARIRLSELFAQRKVDKQYLAVVHNVPRDGESQQPIGRHPQIKTKMAIVPENHGGRPAHSAWRVLYAHPTGRWSLLLVTIYTGRTHQIRVHLHHAGYPIIGDTVYTPAKPMLLPANITRQMLHAWRLRLPHPVTGETLDITCPLPQDMWDALFALQEPLRRVIITGLPGCGKSSFLQALHTQGHPVWSADAEVSRLYAVGAAGHQFFRMRFGSRFVAHPKAAVDRKALRSAMQEDATLRHEVEAAIHHLVREGLDAFWQQCAYAPFAFAEIPLYLEAGWDAGAHPPLIPPLIWGVHCDKVLRHARLQAERGWSVEQCHNMDAWQWEETRKYAACDICIYNSGDMNDLATQASHVLAGLQAERDTHNQQFMNTINAVLCQR